VIGLDPDPDMLGEAERRAAELGIGNARWVRVRAEELPYGLGAIRVATFAASFHWMDRDRVAVAVRDMLEPAGAFVQVSAPQEALPEPDRPLPHPPPPRAAIAALVRRYLGPVRRAGQGVLPHGTPGDEAAVLRRAGFADPEIIVIPGREAIVRTIDDLVATVYSTSSSAPHLFGSQLAEFEGELRALLAEATPSGRFVEQTGDTEVRVWRKPPG
jgi:hypothetical protein